MADIVERLRHGRGLSEAGRRDAFVHAAMQEAADEITALRARVEELEAGLREIAEERFGLGTLGTDYEQMRVWHAHWSRCAERARRALSEEGGRG